MCLGQKQIKSGAEFPSCTTFKHLIASHPKDLPVRVREAHYEEWAVLSMQKSKQDIHAETAMKDEFKWWAV